MIWEMVVRIAGYAGLIGVTLVGLATATYLLFKHLGAKWLDAKFAESLADYQHRQNQEIERLKGEIARLLDRTARLHSAEFEVLPRAWELLGEANGAVGSTVSALKSYSDVTWLNLDELNRVLDQPFIAEFERDRIRALEGRKRQEAFTEIIEVHRYSEASDALRTFNNFIVTKGIFLEPSLSQRFDEIAKALYSVLDDYRFRHFEKSDTPTWTEIRQAWKNVDDLRNALKAAVIARLWANTESGRADV